MIVSCITRYSHEQTKRWMFCFPCFSPALYAAQIAPCGLIWGKDSKEGVHSSQYGILLYRRMSWSFNFTHIHYNTPQFIFHFLHTHSVFPTILLCLLLFIDQRRVCMSKSWIGNVIARGRGEHKQRKNSTTKTIEKKGTQL